MPLKDAVVGWYVKHYIIPRAQILDSPGFVVFNVSGKSPIFARQVIVPELIFILLEKSLIQKFGDSAKSKLYSVGKKFGYRFSIMGKFSQKGDLKEKDLASYIEMINKFIEGTYATNISCSIDIANEVVEYYAKNFVVSSKTGHGYFLPLGAVSGMMSYIFDNPKIEGIQIASQGTGADNCQILCGPAEWLRKRVKNLFTESNLGGLDTEPEYASMNKIQKTENSNYSFSQFIDAGMFSFNQGLVMGGEQRYFIYEISGLHMLEWYLQEEPEAKQIIKTAAYEAGKKIASEFPDSLSERFLMDLFTAFGWGDVLVLEKNKKQMVEFKYAPWTKFCKNIDFIIPCGLLEGFLSIILKRNIKLNAVEKETSQGFLDLLFQED
jgi:predicted hydrocarbon binding protein